MKLTPTDIEQMKVDVPALWNAVLAFRADPQVQQKFACPSTHDSLRFACTEIAEAIDAELRQNALYSRNHEKALEVERELADHVLMLITAHADMDFLHNSLTYVLSYLAHGNELDLYGQYSRPYLLDGLYMRSAQILRDFHAGSVYAWKTGCLVQVIWICACYPHFYAAVQDRIGRLYDKHIAQG